MIKWLVENKTINLQGICMAGVHSVNITRVKIQLLHSRGCAALGKVHLRSLCPHAHMFTHMMTVSLNLRLKGELLHTHRMVVKHFHGGQQARLHMNVRPPALKSKASFPPPY